MKIRFIYYGAGYNRKDENITAYLGYRPPYRWNEILTFFKERSIPGIDLVRDHAYWRTVHMERINKEPVSRWVKISNCAVKNALSITICETLVPVLPQVLCRIKNMFDLSCEPETVYNSLSSMNDICPGLCVLGTRMPGCLILLKHR